MSFDPQSPCYFVNPAYFAAAGATQRVLDPATLEPVGVFAESRPEDIEAAIDAVTQAQRRWMRCDAKTAPRLCMRWPMPSKRPSRPAPLR